MLNGVLSWNIRDKFCLGTFRINYLNVNTGDVFMHTFFTYKFDVGMYDGK